MSKAKLTPQKTLMSKSQMYPFSRHLNVKTAKFNPFSFSIAAKKGGFPILNYTMSNDDGQTFYRYFQTT